jgi:16S rRNA (cytosine967-C5)-methyltransferase
LISDSPARAISHARSAAFDILLRTERENSYASELLHSARYSSLSAADHGLTTQIVLGVLRWRSRLDEAIAKTSSQPLRQLDPEVLAALRMAAYQLFYLDRIPARAAIHESVELVKRARKKSAAGFVNAVLRKLSKTVAEPAKGLADPDSLARSFAHPGWLVARWSAQYGAEGAARICAYDQQAPPTAVRLRDGAAEQELRDAGIALSPGTLLSSARIVASGDITRTAAFREGRVVIGDEGSQLVGALVGQGSRILDCCCAPGGKTSILADANPTSVIVAVELHPHRARLTQKLVQQQNVRVITADARKLPVSAGFDRILVDVPCSGTGTLARNPEIKWRLKPEDFSDLQARQVAILESALKQLAPGGRLVYSSCSLECEENQEVIERALSAHFRVLEVRGELEKLGSSDVLTWCDLSALVEGPFLRTIPGVQSCDGFFAAIIERA